MPYLPLFPPRAAAAYLRWWSALALSVCSVPGQDLCTTSSYLGGTVGIPGNPTSAGDVCAAEIQSDGTVVLAASIGNATPGGLTPILLNGSTPDSSGAVLRLSPDGRTVLSVTRVAANIRDLSVDNADNIFVAALSDGVMKLDPSASSLLWKRNDRAIAFRVDADRAHGGCVSLWDISTSNTAWTFSKGAACQVISYDPQGAVLGSFSTYRGDGVTTDVAYHPGQNRIFTCGWKNTSANGGLTVPWMAARTVTGTVLWTNYDFPYDQVFAAGQISDSFCARVTVGRDGYLYMAGYEAGGASVFTNDPKNLATSVALNNIDQHNEGWRFGDPTNRGFYGRYEPVTGDYLGGALYTAVSPDPAFPANRSGRQLDLAEGDIKADEDGQVYLLAHKNGAAMPYTFDPLGLNAWNGYGTDGASLTVLAPDLNSRRYVVSTVTTAWGGRGHAVAARRIAGQSGPNVVFGGRVNYDPASASTMPNQGEIWTKHAIQPTRAGASIGAGWFTVCVNAPFHPGGLEIVAQPLSQKAMVGQTVTFQVVAKGSGTLTYQWRRNGADLSGATSARYATPALGAGDHGAVYTCVVGDGTDTRTTADAILTIAPTLTGYDLFRQFTANPDDHPLLPDGSYAGYHRGEIPLPEVPVVADLTEFGAVGDGVTDNTEAFRQGIEAAYLRGGGALYVPEGTWLVNDMIRLDRSGVVIRGAGQGQTILFFTRTLQQVLGAFNLGSNSKWNWAGGLLWISPRAPFFTWLDDGGTNPSIVHTPQRPQGYGAFGPEHSWEYLHHGPQLTTVNGTRVRGDTTITVADASQLYPGRMIILSWDITCEPTMPADSLLSELADYHPLLDPWGKAGGYGSWITDNLQNDLVSPGSYPRWQWPVEVRAVNGQEVTLAQPLRVGIQPQWKVRVWDIGETVTESGVEDLTVRGQAGTATGINSGEGWNAVYFTNTYNCWARRVTTERMQGGFHNSGNKQVSILHTNVAGDSSVHHPYNNRCESHDMLFDHFAITATGIGCTPPDASGPS